MRKTDRLIHPAHVELEKCGPPSAAKYNAANMQHILEALAKQYSLNVRTYLYASLSLFRIFFFLPLIYFSLFFLRLRAWVPCLAKYLVAKYHSQYALTKKEAKILAR